MNRARAIFAHSHAARHAPTATSSTHSGCLWIEVRTEAHSPAAVKAAPMAHREAAWPLLRGCAHRLEPWETGRLSDQRERPAGHNTCFPAGRRVGERPESGTSLWSGRRAEGPIRQPVPLIRLQAREAASVGSDLAEDCLPPARFFTPARFGPNAASAFRQARSWAFLILMPSFISVTSASVSAMRFSSAPVAAWISGKTSWVMFVGSFLVVGEKQLLGCSGKLLCEIEYRL